MVSVVIQLMEHGYLPDSMIRFGIRKLLRERLKTCELEKSNGSMQRFVNSLSSGPVALVPEKANEQHYELPADFFELVLGPNRKYSSCHYNNRTDSLEQAEQNMLSLTCERAEISDGMDILELGCGWGSLSLWMARRYPKSRITGVSNSSEQRKAILDRAAAEGLTNIEIITADMNSFEINRQFDRVVSVEMFEHMHNYQELLHRISQWLKPDGKLFVHIFSHRTYCYPFVTQGDSDWMATYFFTGGLMPSHNLLSQFNKHLTVEADWFVSGVHYSKSSRDWLINMKLQREAIIDILHQHYGKNEARLWFQRWRIFFMACEELFGMDNGKEWGVSHLRFVKNAGTK
ncbi:MAG: cyclopropane-fatty-acyl-phospholipid synthase family protein [bacterium]|nr:cyclopropane-fatty-acyl-phospholipid synthase family protein [bacterium]